MTSTVRVLTINTGSSSLKAALYAMHAEERLAFFAHGERIGSAMSQMSIMDAQGAPLLQTRSDLPDHAASLQILFGWLREQSSEDGFDVVGHRVVFGGDRYSQPRFITDELRTDLQGLSQFDPNHMPQALHAIEFVGQAYPHVPQVACFDTAFHHDMPRVARLYGLPYALAETGVVRYGFHGLSYESIVRRLRAEDNATANGRVIIAHLGNGASMAALLDGKSRDTTMGFTPTGGLMMGTRSGDLDPGVVLYVLEAQKLSSTALRQLLNHESGLLGISGTSGDMRDLLRQSSTTPRAAEAIELFCYQARKFLGGLVVALGGLDTLVFTGGIGERAASVRQRICADLEFLGIQLDPPRNDADAPIISEEGSQVTVRVMKTEEDLMIARHAYQLMEEGASAHV